MEDKKSEFRKKLEMQLDELEVALDNLKLKAKDATADVKEKYTELIDELEPKLEAGRAKMKELLNSTDEAWDDISDGAASIWEPLKVTFKNVKDRFDGDEEEKATD